MRCDDCYGEVRPVVGIDIDGTIADYHKVFQAFVARYFGTAPKRASIRNWDGEGEMEDFLGITKEQYREAKLAYRQGGNKRWSPMYPGADMFIRLIKQMGADVWLNTQRPWMRLDNIDPDTRFWLELHDIEYDGLLYDEDKYERLCERVDPERIVGVVDDLSTMLARASELGLRAFQIEREHNEHFTARWGPRGDFSQAAEWIKGGIEQWIETSTHSPHTHTSTR